MDLAFTMNIFKQLFTFIYFSFALFFFIFSYFSLKTKEKSLNNFAWSRGSKGQGSNPHNRINDIIICVMPSSFFVYVTQRRSWGFHNLLACRYHLFKLVASKFQVAFCWCFTVWLLTIVMTMIIEYYHKQNHHKLNWFPTCHNISILILQ